MQIKSIDSLKTEIPFGSFSFPTASDFATTSSSTTSSWSKFTSESMTPFSDDLSLNTVEEQFMEDLFDAIFDDNIDKVLVIVGNILDHTQQMEEGDAKTLLQAMAYSIRMFIRVDKDDVLAGLDDYLLLRDLIHPEMMSFGDWDRDLPSFNGVAYLAKGEEARGIEALIYTAQQGDLLSRVILREKQVSWTPISIEFPDFEDMDSPIWKAEMNRAANHCLQGEYEEALQICNEVIEKYSETEATDSNVIAHFNFKTDPAYNMRADIYMAMGRYKEAKQEYQKLLSHMHCSDISMNLAVASKLLGEEYTYSSDEFQEVFYLKLLDFI